LLLLTVVSLAKDKPAGKTFAGAAGGKALAPFACRWDGSVGNMARFYPQKPMSETDFWEKFGGEFGLTGKNESKLERESASLSGTHKRYAQYYQGVRVKEGELLVNLNDAGEIISVFSNLIKIDAVVSVIPSVSVSDAEKTAFRGIDQNNLRGEARHSLNLYSTDFGVKLVWVWEIPAFAPLGDWEVIIDAVTGEALSRKDVRRFWVTGTGDVFIPDPKTAIESDTLLDHNNANWAIPPESYSTVDLLELADAVGGYYYLTGPYCNTIPTANRAQEITPSFIYQRQDDRFEEVNTYYHIDTYQRYIQSLGFTGILNYSFPFDVNGTTEDNSWFSPYAGTITLGSGGVDDGEDADVIIHEYGHAMQWGINPGLSGGHTGAMGEGFGDYIAGTYSLNIDPVFHPNWVFTWDGHNQFWAGRVLNMPYHYPENAGGEVHDSGQLWSAGLIDVWYDVPAVALWDMLVFQHHYYLGNGATMEDAANAILLADIEINQGAYREIIIDNFVERGFLDPAYLAPQITHNPLTDSEDTLQIEFPIYAEIVSAQPLDSATVMLHWGLNGNLDSSMTMTAAGNDTFCVVIPGPFNGDTVNYYISAADIYGGMGFAPPEGLPEIYSFYVGADVMPPEITLLDTLRNTVFHYGNEEIRIIASDNIGIANVDFYYRQENGVFQSLPMTHLTGDTFTVTADWEGLEALDNYYYYFAAWDVSANTNETVSEIFSFQVSTEAEFDGFERGMGQWITDDSWRLQSVRVFSGAYALNDRDETGYVSAEEVGISLAEAWDTRDILDMHMKYWTQYFMIPQNDTGFVEIFDGLSWIALDTVTGAIPTWEERTVVLADYLPADSLTIRFRTKSNSAWPNPALGWYIDRIILSTEPMVASESPESNNTAGEWGFTGISPNPGNSRFLISFNLPEEGNVEIAVFDVLGREVEALGAGGWGLGKHTVVWDAGGQASGIYFVRLMVDGRWSMVRKIVLMN